MNAQLKQIEARCIGRPSYMHWNLVQSNDQAAWILANWEAIKTRFRSYGEIVADDCTLQQYAEVQWDLERARHDEAKREYRESRYDYEERE
jgi:hypothetical protein